MASQRPIAGNAGSNAWLVRMWHAPRTTWILAIVATAVAATVGVLAYNSGVSTAVAERRRHFLDETEILAAALERRAQLSHKEAIAEIEALWHAHAPGSGGCCMTLSIWDKSGDTLFHARHAEQDDTGTTDHARLDTPRQTTADLRSILASQTVFSGNYRTEDGGLEEAAFAPVPSRDWVIGIHAPRTKLAAHARSNLKYLTLGFLIACGGLLPFSVYLIHRTVHRSRQARREAERHLRFSRSSMDSATEAMLITTASGEIVDVNDRACQLLGYTPEQLKARTLADLDTTTPAGRLPAPTPEIERSGGVTVETVFKTSAGDHVPVDLYLGHVGGEESSFYCLWAHDLTNRKATEAALAESEQRYRTLVETMNEGVAVEDADGTITYVNDRFCEIVGFAQTELIGQRTATFLLDEKNRRILEAQNIMRRDGLRQRYELCMTHKDGHQVPLGISPAPLTDANGVYVGSFGVVTDVSERKRTELQLEQAHQRLSLHMDSSPLAVIEWDENFRFKRWSTGAARIFGWKPEEVIGEDWFAFDFVGEADIQDVLAMANRLLDGVDEHNVCYTTNLTKDGSSVDCEWHNSVLLDEHKSTISFLSLIQDVTARHRAVASLRESEERLQAIVEHMPAMLAAFDTRQHIIHWNKECERVTGYRPTEIVDSDHALGMLYPDPAYLKSMQAEWVRRGDDFHLWEWELTCKDGSTRTIAWSNVSRFCPIPGWASWIVGVDVTDRKLAEAERTQLAEQLRQSQKMEAVGTLATGIAHDFNNLLTAITGYADLARIASQDNEQALAALSGIDQAARQASDVTKSLLTFTRSTQTRKAPVDLCQLLHDSARMLRRILPVAVEIVVSAPKDEPMWVNGDPTQLRQVVLNLAVNARDAMPDGGQLTLQVGPDPRVPMPRPGASVACAHGTAALVVRDTGNGMCEEVRDRIFEPFFTTKPRGQGTGLGMAVVHGIITEHKGQILVESVPDEGTTLTMLLARCQPPGDATPEPRHAQARTGNGETIVLAEDNAQVRGILSTMLGEAGYTVHSAANGVDAMKLVDQHASDVRMLIVDIELPRLPGSACIDQVRSTKPAMPIIAITGSEEFTLDTTDTDRLALLRKPFVMSDLVDRVGRMLTGRTPKEVSNHATHQSTPR